MKNKGLTFIIIIAVLALLTGSYFMWNKEKIESALVEEVDKELPEENLNTEKEQTPSPTTTPQTGSEVNIDTELKDLDAEMGSVWEKDSDSDPTLGI